MYLLVAIYGLTSMSIGIGPAVGFAIWRHGKEIRNWIPWALGGAFWFLALLCRLPLLGLVAGHEAFPGMHLVIAPLLAGIFETAFRVALFLLLPKLTASTKGKVVMAGLGWGTVEAIYVHTIQVGAIVFFPGHFPGIIGLLDGVEWTLLFGGYERLITIVFHAMIMVLVFYGVKGNLRGIERSTPLIENFFTRDPRPKWLWIFIAIGIHFLYDFVLVVLLYTMGLIILYMFGTVFVCLLASYVTRRTSYYPLFPTSSKREGRELEREN